MIKLYAGAAVTAVALGIGASVLFTMRSGGDGPFDPCRVGVVSGVAQIGGPFTLVAHTGETVTEEEVFTKPSLVYFGYTFCPDVCPLDVVRNVDAVELLVERGKEIRPVFVTIDPTRDTPEVLEDYASYMYDDMIGLSGSEEQIRAAAAAYGVYSKKQDTGDEYYLMDHSTFSYLVFPEHGFVEFFRRDLSAEALAERVACFLDAA